MPFFVYIIRSVADRSYYKGFTIDPKRRLEEHNSGLSHYTSAKIPWELVYLEISNDKTRCTKEMMIHYYNRDRIGIKKCNSCSRTTGKQLAENFLDFLKTIYVYRTILVVSAKQIIG